MYHNIYLCLSNWCAGELFVLWWCRFETLEPEMNNIASRIADVNQVAEQLLNSDNCNKEQINQTHDQLNDRYMHKHTIKHNTAACVHTALSFLKSRNL